MVKNVFVYLVIIVLIGLTVWFFIRKANTVSQDSDLTKLAGASEISPTPSPESVIGGAGTWLKLPSGLEVMDVTIGYGQEAKEGDMVAAHYNGTLTDGTKFDSSYDRNQPFSFILGGGMVIKGWDIGLVGMKVGGKRKLRIPPELAYGDKVVGDGLIPANSTLLFDIELVAAQSPKAK